jgi:hypothetical protein
VRAVRKSLGKARDNPWKGFERGFAKGSEIMHASPSVQTRHPAFGHPLPLTGEGVAFEFDRTLNFFAGEGH